MLYVYGKFCRNRMKIKEIEHVGALAIWLVKMKADQKVDVYLQNGEIAGTLAWN
jgi:hypothetical protein